MVEFGSGEVAFSVFEVVTSCEEDLLRSACDLDLTHFLLGWDLHHNMHTYARFYDALVDGIRWIHLCAPTSEASILAH